MNSRLRVGVVAGVLAGAVVFGGSVQGRAPKPKPVPPLSARIVGEWKSEPFEASVGKATQMFCFRADGTVAVRTETTAGPLSNSGAYVLETDRITVKLANPASSLTLRVSWSGEQLVLTDESARARSYSRGAKEC
jgi:hypothetical protein